MEQDYDLLSNYIDGSLDAAERAMLETRLAQDAELRRELAALQQTVILVKNLPTLKAPRDFTITPQMVKQRQPNILRLLPVLSAAAAAIVVLILGGTVLLNSGTQTSTAPSQVALGRTGTAAPTTMQRAQTVVAEHESVETDEAVPFIFSEPATEDSDLFDATMEMLYSITDDPNAGMQADEAAGEGPMDADQQDDEAAEESAASGMTESMLVLETPTVTFFGTAAAEDFTTMANTATVMPAAAGTQPPIADIMLSTEMANAQVAPPATTQKLTEEAQLPSPMNPPGSTDRSRRENTVNGFLATIITLILQWLLPR